MIKQFTGKYQFLSNFHLCLVEYEGLIYPSAEHAYQAQKTDESNLADDAWKSKCQGIVQSEQPAHICPLFTPGKIKKMSYNEQLRDGWEGVKMGIMEGVLLAKFKQNKYLRDRLLATGNEELQEGNSWHDTFWGIDSRTGYGENHLGKLLMKVRKQLKV